MVMFDPDVFDLDVFDTTTASASSGATSTSLIVKYDISATALSVGDQPFKKKAKFEELTKWKYIDKLNKIKEFSFTVPNDEFHRTNALLERAGFVPFIKPFRGIVCEKATNETTIELKICELAWHFTRRIFRQNGNARVVYGAPLTHIQFEDDVFDKGAQSNDGTWTGTETYSPGKIDRAGDFNGSSRVKLANEANLDILLGSMTVTFWVKRSAVPSVSEILCGKIDTTPASGYRVFIDTSGIINTRFNDGTNNVLTTFNTVVTDNLWNYVTVVFDRVANQVIVYVNNVKETTVGDISSVTGSVNSPEQFAIGASPDGSSPFTGQIDDVKIFNRIVTADTVKQLFKTSKNPPEDRDIKTGVSVKTIAQDILTHANTDMPSGLTWTLDQTFPTDIVIVEFNYDFNYDALMILAENLSKDLFFDNERHIVQIATKGKTLGSDEELDIIITSQPKISTENFANHINMLGKSTNTGEQLEELVTTPTVLSLNYEKVITDSKITSQDQLKGVGNSLLDEFKKLTPSIKGEVPYDQFVRLNIESGDTIPISQPQKQLNGTFRVMDIIVTEGKAKLSLESTETGIIRLRSKSLSDIIGGILDKIQDQSIET